ncbi:MAG: histidinol-phosphate transaminase [Candidatus Aminicenantia bacterium]
MKELFIPNKILEIKPYVPGKPVEEVQREKGLKKVIKLASNENPLGPSPKAVEAILRNAGDSNYYPEDDAYYLREEIARFINFPKEWVIVGAGGAELIKMIARAFLDDVDKSIVPEKSFLMYTLAVQETVGKGGIIKVPQTPDYKINVDAIVDALEERVKIIWIANPNNPTGSIIKKEELEKLLNAMNENQLLIYDEAYNEYVDEPDYPFGFNYLRKGEKRIIILRTFSKIYGLAGLRVGYAVCAPEIVEILFRVKTPFNVPRISQEAAISALHDIEHVKRSIETNRKGREFLSNAFKDLSFKFIPTQANFITIIPEFDPLIIYEKLLEKGIIVRPIKSFEMPEGLRITIGKEVDNTYLVDCLKEIVQELKK